MDKKLEINEGLACKYGNLESDVFYKVKKHENGDMSKYDMTVDYYPKQIHSEGHSVHFELRLWHCTEKEIATYFKLFTDENFTSLFREAIEIAANKKIEDIADTDAVFQSESLGLIWT